jgi:predicted GH43/DUF377 family glycosyl hydrolase
MFTVRRSSSNPFVRPENGTPWEAVAAFNPSPVKVGDKGYVLYRAASAPDLYKGQAHLELSTIAIAPDTADTVSTEHRQLIIPEEDWERYGCEDPRVTYFEGVYYIFYTAISEYPFQPGGIRVGLATSRDLKTIDSKHLITPFNAKAMTLFPERVGGKLCVVLTANSDMPPSRTGIALFDKPEDLWNEDYWNDWYAHLDDHTIDLSRSDGDHPEVGAAPIRTDEGWLLLYAHIEDYFTDDRKFGIEAALLDFKDPRKIISRTNFPFMVPEEVYEKYGRLPKIIFPSGMSHDGDTLSIYYGSTDTTCCRATLSLKALMASLSGDGGIKQQAKRYAKNPILAPIQGHPWESSHVLNPAAIEIDGTIYILYRAVGPENTSVVGLAKSKDGFTIDERLPEPIYVPRADFEQKHGGPTDNSGCEDARVVRIGDRLHITYTAYDSVSHPKVATSSISVKDFLAHDWDGWTTPEIISPDGVDDKDACIIPEKKHDRYMILHRIEGHVCADYVDSLNFKDMKLTRCIQIIGPRPGMWDSRKVGIAGPPIKTDKGWLLFYHGITNAGHYCLGAALLDTDDHTKVIGRSVLPLMSPVEPWEKEGWIPNVVFPCGQVVRGNTIYLYYGGADHVIGVATLDLATITDSLAA